MAMWCSGPGHVEEAPEVELPGEGRLDAALEEVGEHLVGGLLLVQERLGEVG